MYPISVSQESKDTVYKGFNLDGYQLHPNPISAILSGKYTVFDSRFNVVARLQFQASVLSGDCEFYQNGVVSEIRPYQNDIAEGWGRCYENGTIVKCFYYHQGKRVRYVEKECTSDFWKEVDVSTGNLLSLCKFDLTHFYRYGYGCVYSNHQLSKWCEFDHDREVRVIKEFSGSTMIEYDQKHHRIYEGGFLDDLTQAFPRNGQGTSFRNNKPEYKGYWQQNIPNGSGVLLDRKGVVLHNGVWKEGKLNEIEYTSKGFQKTARINTSKVLPLKRSKRSSWVWIVFVIIVVLLVGGTWAIAYFNRKEATIHTKKEYDRLPSSIKHLTISPGSCNEEDFKTMDLSRFHRLESISIGDNSLHHVEKVSFTHLHHLSTIQIGDHVFSDSSPSQSNRKSLQIQHCEALKSISIGVYSFSDYSHFGLARKVDLVG